MATDPAVVAAFDALLECRTVANTERIAVAVVAAVRPIVIRECAEAIEAEADRNPKGFREHAAIHSFVDSREWLRYASRLVRGLAGHKEDK